MKIIKPFWEPDGYFDLSDSDNHVGSLYTIEDMTTILSIPDENKDFFVEMLRRGGFLTAERRIKEPDLQRDNIWKCIMKHCYSQTPKRFQSLSELELIAIIEKVYGNDVTIETQVKVKNKYIDIKVRYKKKDYYIEFLGPQHFYNDENIDDDDKRKKLLEEALNTKIVEWPYWMLLSENNVRFVFGEKNEGKGAIWGSEVFWGNVSKKVSDRVIELSKSFNATRSDGIGYFYEEWKDSDNNLIKPAHPIIEAIKKGKKKLSILLPSKIGDEGKQFWLPKELWHKI